MKTKAILLTMTALLAFSLPAAAQEEGTAPPEAMMEEAPPTDPAVEQARFMIAKARMLEHLKSVEGCVQAAANVAMIHACMEPRRPAATAGDAAEKPASPPKP